ncbi:MAG TPA: cell division protein FtsL [Syntrophobacter fumaroxidans]|nr:cell division protein FtsL [Syntrophobacter fumaroxidans]
MSLRVDTKLRFGGDFDPIETSTSGIEVKLWLASSAFLVLVFVTCAIFYVWLYIQQVQNGYRLARYFQEHDQLITIQRKLRLEWSRFQDPYLLEEMGRKQFGLNPPKPDQKMTMH